MVQLGTLRARFVAVLRQHPLGSTLLGFLVFAANWDTIGGVVEQTTPWELPKLDDIASALLGPVISIFPWWGWVLIAISCLAIAVTFAFEMLATNSRLLKANAVRLDDLSAAVAKLDQRGEAVASFIAQQVEQTVREEALRLIDELQAFYDQQEGELVIRTQNFSSTRIVEIRKRLNALGYGQDEITRLQTESAERIRSDAQFFILNENDRYPWRAGEAKRMWHVREAQLDVFRQLATKERRAPADPIALLSKLNE
ncbi:hypothetical protein [Caulobacter sp. CCG-8]|uniref:hypothetical protein n=1 Tax=Caulobacter sp. CCG-8 TaxID=3127958 RepID=UPI00307F8CEA